MRISRWCYLTAVAALAAALVAPATASALLTNEWNQQFAGTEACVLCHGSAYNETTHGLFARTGEELTPAADSAMWPVGITAHGNTYTSTDVFALGWGTGLQEYIKFGAGNATSPFGVLTAEWDPALPALWEIDGTTGVVSEGGYACNQCHMLGSVKAGITPPATGNFAPGGAFNRVAGSSNTWAMEVGADDEDFDSYIPGASIQCERCHGTGVAASVDAGGHWSSGVQIVGFNKPAWTSSAKAASLKLLKSEGCGQCHGSFKSGGNIAGFTPDATITAFVPNQYTSADVPTEASFTANPAAYKFWPTGQTKGISHVYYTEWAMSGHSVRGALTSSTPGVTPYQAEGHSHYTAQSSSSRLACNRCHTGEGYLKRKLDADAPLGNIMSSFPEVVTNEGYLGTECADCHIAHGAETEEGGEVGMGVREPEKANGDYSTKGLNKDNISICEDCHNWQMEVMALGGTPATPALPAILGKYVSHPQREVYEGRAMLEIPNAKVFMSGANGEDPALCHKCHMPATRGGSDESVPRATDRFNKRYSHRMFIMMPGDAAEWGLGPAGDSCSPCHLGETQEGLQGSIDTWQETAADLAADVTAELNAAVASSDRDTAAGDIDLLKRASANLSLYTQDGSGGVHNVTYEQAGLAKALQLAKSAGGEFDALLAPARVGSGALFGIQGIVKNGDESAAAGVTVELLRGSTHLGWAVSDVNGNFAFSFAQTSGATYTVKWARSSQAVSDLTASVTVDMDVVIIKKGTDLTLSTSRTSYRRSQIFTLRGELHEDEPGDVDVDGATIVLTYKKPGMAAWHSWVTRTTNADGEFSWITRNSTLGVTTYRARFAGDAEYLASSATTKVTIVR